MEKSKINAEHIQNPKSILILGSGLVSEPVIDYLLKRPENQIILASNSQEQISKIISKKRNLETHLIDIIKNKEKLNQLVKRSDLVISLIPPFLHIFVAKACLECRKNLVTTSYISEEIKKMDKAAKENNLQFIFEIGISPGLDHIMAFKVIEEQKKQGNVIIGYESWCGAIPSPECIDNPLLYKFSWNPKGALMILKNDARQLINGKVVKIPEKNLFTSALVDKKFHPSLNLEGYYNRDSIKYRELYNLTAAKSVIRGLIRYQGFTFTMQCFKNLNLLSFERVDERVRTWRDFLNKILKNPRNEDTIYEMKSKYIKKGIEIFLYNNKICDTVAERLFYFNLALLAISHFEDKYIRKYGFEFLFNRIYSVLIYLDFYNENNELLSKESVLDALSKLLEKKIIIKEYERDMVFMQSEFQIKNKNGAIVNMKYDLITFGGHNNLPYTATSILVGFPAAIVAQLVLDNKIKEKGVLLPSSEVVYNTVIEELRKINIYFHESIEMKAKF